MAAFKVAAVVLLITVVAQVSLGDPRELQSTGIERGTLSNRGSRDPVLASAVGPAAVVPKDPKKDVETFGIGTLTPRPTTVSGSRNFRECPGAWDGPSNVTVVLLETRADQLESEVKTPRRSVAEALGADNVRRLHAEFATAAAGFRGILPDARRLAAEDNQLPCAERKTTLKRYTQKNAEFTKKVAEGYAVLAQKVREAITKLGTKADNRLKHAADEYESLGGTYLQAHGRADRQRVAAAKLT